MSEPTTTLKTSTLVEVADALTQASRFTHLRHQCDDALRLLALEAPGLLAFVGSAVVTDPADPAANTEPEREIGPLSYTPIMPDGSRLEPKDRHQIPTEGQTFDHDGVRLLVRSVHWPTAVDAELSVVVVPVWDIGGDF